MKVHRQEVKFLLMLKKRKTIQNTVDKLNNMKSSNQKLYSIFAASNLSKNGLAF